MLSMSSRRYTQQASRRACTKCTSQVARKLSAFVLSAFVRSLPQRLPLSPVRESRGQMGLVPGSDRRIRPQNTTTEYDHRNAPADIPRAPLTDHIDRPDADWRCDGLCGSVALIPWGGAHCGIPRRHSACGEIATHRSGHAGQHQHDERDPAGSLRRRSDATWSDR